MSDYFAVRCSVCGRTIRIYSVCVFGRGEFSYGYDCECGCALRVDGVSGDDIPESLKREAEQRRAASDVKSEIDHQRRGLPTSDTKRMLRESRLPVPIEQDDGSWLVYGIDDRTQVLYITSGCHYRLVGSDRNPMDCVDVEALVRHLRQFSP